MADKKSQISDRKKSSDYDNFLQIRAKGQYLQVPKELDNEDFKGPSGTGKYLLRYFDIK